ncbi:MAG: resolvase-like protein [archaeon GW2011_AR3]|nr:MAG: resolvase-like protein [archaeon GW2011_AR3]MBS3109465.1 recombinase family protein [Candidatus Woesearchaeota archaeon]
MKVGIYARVSTKEQNVENQMSELTKYCQARNYEIFKVYTEVGVSGSKESRPSFDCLMNDAHKRKFDILLVWKLDRLSRSLKHLLNTLDTLNSLNISFVSYNDNIDTTTPQGKLMFQLIGAFAEFERELIRERVCLGLRRARTQGKALGRKKLDINKYQVAQLRSQGMSLRTIAKELNVSVGTVYNLLSVQKTLLPK